MCTRNAVDWEQLGELAGTRASGRTREGERKTGMGRNERDRERASVCMYVCVEGSMKGPDRENVGEREREKGTSSRSMEA